MKYNDQFRIRDAAQARLADIVFSAMLYGPSHEALNRQRLDVVNNLPKSTTQRVKAYLDGYWEARIDELYRDHLVHGGFVQDKFYSTHSNREDYYWNNGIEPNAWAIGGIVRDMGHYWKHNLNPFFTN